MKHTLHRSKNLYCDDENAKVLIHKILTMKTSFFEKSATNILLLFSVLSITMMLASCARKMTFATSRVAPAAEGHVKIKKDKNNNYSINLKVRRLADPGRLRPSKRTYVVWMETQRDGTKNIGNLRTSSALFSKTLKSSLNTVSPFKPTGFLITAENSDNITYPNGEIVLRTR